LNVLLVIRHLPLPFLKWTQQKAFASLQLQNLAAKFKSTQNTFLYFNHKLRSNIRQQNFAKGRGTHWQESYDIT
jgi:hypothetical protein